MTQKQYRKDIMFCIKGNIQKLQIKIWKHYSVKIATKDKKNTT